MKPLGIWKSILFFGIPALLMNVIYRGVMTFLDLLGLRLFMTFLIGFGVPSLLLLLVAFLFYRSERSGSFVERFRLQNPNTNIWIWSIILCAIWVVIPSILKPATEWIQANLFAPDKLWVRMVTPDPNYFMDFSFAGNLWIYPAIAVFAVVNVLGGELFWRGYIFPRQELAFGSNAWIIHALFWIAFRAFLPWELATIVVQAFTLTYVVQRTRSTWPAILAHLCGLVSAFLR